MRKRRRKVRFSTLGLLERLWLRKRARFDTLEADFPEASQSVLSRNLHFLRNHGLARRHAARNASRPWNPYYWWKATPRGVELARRLYMYRDWWELIEWRDLDALTRAEACLEKLDGLYKDCFPQELRKAPRRDFWRRDPPAA